MMDNQEMLHRYIELESENKSLKAEVKRLKTSLSIYTQTNLDFKSIKLPGNLAPQAGDCWLNNKGEDSEL